MKVKGKVLITGVAGFIGSHLAEYLIKQGYAVVGIDNLLTGDKRNVHPQVKFGKVDIAYDELWDIKPYMENVDYVFHLAAIARTPWTIDDPLLCNNTNITGTLKVLEAARKAVEYKEAKIKKVIFASSNIVYAAPTPYKVSKLTGEWYMETYKKLYNLPTISLRFSNIYGSLRQSEKGPAINVLASLRKTKREKGYIEITGDGTQSRDFTHVLDLVEAMHKAAITELDPGMPIDICTGTNYTMNQIAQMFDCEVKYVPERRGDIKHIHQDPGPAKHYLGFKAKRMLPDNIGIYSDV